MSGLSRTLGTALDEAAHLAQSVADILCTPLGSRVMRRDYGSTLFELVDAPFNAVTRMRLIAATADALRRWEPRLLIRSIRVDSGSAPGEVILSLDGARVDASQPNALVNLTIPLRAAAGGFVPAT